MSGITKSNNRDETNWLSCIWYLCLDIILPECPIEFIY
jgi:hypothetical protein